MQFKLWLENGLPKFASWNSYGDLVVYIGPVKYTFHTRNAQLARNAYAASKFDPWGTLERLKKAGYEVKKDSHQPTQLSLF